MFSTTNDYQRSYLTKRSSKEKTSYTCITYVDEPMKYSIAESKRLLHVNEDGFGIINEFGKSYNVHVEQTGTQASMEGYGLLLERAMKSQMHEEVPSDCEDWKIKKQKETRLKNSTPTLTSNPVSTIREERQTTSSKEMLSIIVADDEISTINEKSAKEKLSSLSCQYDSINVKSVSSSKIRVLAEREQCSPNLDNDEVEEEKQLSLSSDEDDFDANVSSNSMKNQHKSSFSKKRSTTQTAKLPIRDRHRAFFSALPCPALCPASLCPDLSCPDTQGRAGQGRAQGEVYH
ncbi:unnamed protein product [Rotaria socialis]|uniref:Uncharacterized protein n=3 Tax=Rotaria socialis TaxID=392032 RepID=A0A820W5F2_9BILA|nr:unnamed protein product [Rotaria socialis]CAF4511631.1 unnamed protein product [Rotaria socialis]